MRKLVWFCFLSSSILVGCASTTNYQAALNSWQGAPIEQLISHWGPPINSYIGPDGNRIYMYTEEGTGPQPVSGMSIGYGTGGYAPSGLSTGIGFGMNQGSYSQDVCTTWVEVNKQNQIMKTYAKGAGCVATTGDLKNLANPFNPPLQPVN